MGGVYPRSVINTYSIGQIKYGSYTIYSMYITIIILYKNTLYSQHCIYRYIRHLLYKIPVSQIFTL